MNSIFYGNTLRDYIRVIFRRKNVIIAIFLIIMIGVYIGWELNTPLYQAHVKLLITGEKQTTSPYYKGLKEYQQLSEAEIVISNPVMERAVIALKLHERPVDYEKNFCTPLKSWFIDTRWAISKFMSESKFMSKRKEPQDISPEQEQENRLRMAANRLKGVIEVEPIRGTDLFTINANDFSSTEAAMIANVVSRSYVIFNLEQQIAELQLQYGEKYPLVAQLKDYINEMIKNITTEKLSAMEAVGPASIKIIEQAQLPPMPEGIGSGMVLLLAIFMGVFSGVMLAFGLEYIDHSFKSPQDVEIFLNLPLLGSIPKRGFKNNALIKDSKQTSAFTQPYQNLADQIYLLMKDKNLKSILITAASPLEGSTTITANLANFLSNKAGHKVMVIDANLKAPSIHKVFNISDGAGLANVLEGKISLEKAVKDLGHNLTVLPAGNTSLNPTPLLDSTRMSNVIKTAKEMNELVFIDYANLRSFKDACVLCPYLDGIILVVNEGKTRHQVIKTLIAPLKHKKANLIGVVLNNRTYAIPKMIYERL